MLVVVVMMIMMGPAVSKCTVSVCPAMIRDSHPQK